jgi:uncharacterized membrane protein
LSAGIAEVAGNESARYDAIMLISDGQHNSVNDVISTAKIVEVPVWAVYPAELNPVTDISVTDVRSSDYALKNVPIDITVMYYAVNLAGRDTVVYLKKDKELIATKRVIITQDGPGQVEFSFTPSRVGLETYAIEIPPFAEETVVTNNKRSFQMETIREKLRILYICGQPNPEYYFLRYFLKSDPAIELVSFVILRNPENVEVVPDEQLSLIPFPTHEIFLKDLFDFDVFIFENFNYTKFYIYPAYLENLKRFVKEKGGGFLMIGGDNSFGKGNYRGSPIEEIIPVQMDMPDEPAEDGLFKLRVVNPSHPIMMLTDDVKENEHVWSTGICQLDTCQRLRPKQGATVLAEHSTAKTDKGNVAVIACGEYGKGRSIAIGTNTMWRIALSAETSTEKKYYVKFWKNVIKWLSKSEDTKSFRVSVTHRKYVPGEKIEMKLLALDTTLKNCSPKLYVTDPLLRIKQVTDVSESYNGWRASGYIVDQPGKYTVTGRLERNNKIVASDTIQLLVTDDSNKEELQLSLNKDLLTRIADLTGGQCLPMTNVNINDLAAVSARSAKPAIKKQVNLRAIPATYFIVLILLVVEWILRRLKGLL